MKQNPQFVNGYRAPRYLAKVSRESLWQRLIWWAFRRYLLNEDYYRVSRRFTGPRPKRTCQHSTLKVNATGYRYYIEAREQPRPWLKRVIELRQQHERESLQVVREYPSGTRIVREVQP